MRNLNKPNRYNVASIQAQQTLGGDVMQSDENGQFVEWRDYAWLLSEKQRLQAEVERLRKAGIAMGMCLPDTDEANKAYKDFEAGGKQTE